MPMGKTGVNDQPEGNDLNDAQRRAVTACGPVLVLAGAGAGKTKTIAARIARLITEGREPESILAITFTNKTAREMRERVLKMIAENPLLRTSTQGAGEPFVSTFHSLCAYLIREHARLMGLPRHFSIYDRADSRQAVKETMAAIGVDHRQIEPGNILAAISREKGNLTTPETWEARAEGDYGALLVARIWRGYDERLRRERALDFDDLLVKAVELLTRHDDVRDRYQKQWRAIHVDEYQDTNRAQYELLRQLVGERRDLFAVGDIDQTIYTWRGAYIKNLLNFEKDYPGTTVVLLEENYRSTKNILAAANSVIRKNTVRYDKNLYTKNGVGEPIGVYAAYDETDEASFVVERCRRLIATGVPAGEIAVLYRANFQSRAPEQAFLEAGLPYQVLGTRFFERREIKDILAFIKAAQNREDLASFKRIANVPPRGLGKLTLLKVFAGKENELSGAQALRLREFKALLSRIAEAARTRTPSETVKFVLAETGLRDSFARGSEEDKERLENTEELVTVAARYDALPPYEGIERLLTDSALASEQDNIKDERAAVRLMTTHAAKGLEFDYVFITGLEQDLFPHARSRDSETVEEAEEERRLFYVALTRARRKVFLSYAGVRTIFGSRQVNLPSEFLADIDESLTMPENHPGTPLADIRFD